MNKLYLLLGSNIGDSKIQLDTAINHIENNIGIVIKKSSLYKTAAWGNNNQNNFTNQVILVESILGAEDVIQLIFRIEKQMGRVRTIKNAAREIDIDILFFNNEIINTEYLTVPHKEIQNRMFVIVPMMEIAPELKHPLLKKDISTLLLLCKDDLNVQKI